METKKLLRHIAKKFPKKLKNGYDYVGLQTGKIKENTNNILLCLDFDEVVYSYIVDNNLADKIDLIITHHPFIYGTKSKVFKDDENKKILCQKIDDLNIPVYSYHTNFDRGEDGMNDALANKLELIDIHPLKEENMARGGYLKKEMGIEEFANYAKNKLNVDYGLLLPYGKKEIKSVAIIGGGGWHDYRIAQKEGYDIYISGDIPHHGRRGVISYQYNYLDLPHEIENIFIPQMEKILNNIDPTLNIYPLIHENNAKVI